MRIANRRTARRGALLTAVAAGLMVSTAGHAGGPLYVTPVAGKLEPLRWEHAVTVYTDVSDLGSLPNAKARELVAFSLDQWSSVPTATLQVSVAGTFADLGLGDITGDSAGSVAGT